MTNSNTTKIEVYDLPENATIGGEWNLPEHFVDTYDSINAPYWDFPFPEFTAYIKAVTPTNDPNIVEVEYYVYRLDRAHCAGYYSHWSTGTAMVDIKTHKRWDVA